MRILVQKYLCAVITYPPVFISLVRIFVLRGMVTMPTIAVLVAACLRDLLFLEATLALLI